MHQEGVPKQQQLLKILLLLLVHVCSSSMGAKFCTPRIIPRHLIETAAAAQTSGTETEATARLLIPLLVYSQQRGQRGANEEDL